MTGPPVGDRIPEGVSCDVASATGTTSAAQALAEEFERFEAEFGGEAFDGA